MPQGDGVARPAKKRGWTKEKRLPAFDELAYNELAVAVETPSLNEAGAIVALNEADADKPQKMFTAQPLCAALSSPLRDTLENTWVSPSPTRG